MARTRYIVFVAILASMGGAAWAHHAFAAEFDVAKPITLSGTVSKTEWQNPHARFYLDVRDPKGQVTRWELSLGSPNNLIRQGWTRRSLQAGDMVTVTGYLARDRSHLVACRTINFADGHSVGVGASGDGGPSK
jgi:hypothetical protein